MSQPLADDHIAVLRRIGEVRQTHAGEVLIREGDRGYDFFVVLSGSLKICDRQAGVERDLATWGAREFAGGLGLLTGERSFTTVVIVEPGELLVVPADKLQRLISRDQVLGDLIVRAAMARRDWLLNARTGMRIIGSRSQPQTRGLLEFAERNRLPHVWLDIDADPAADVVLDYYDTPRDQTPVVVMRGGDMLCNPSNAELARAAGIGTAPRPGVTYDVAIIGAGPAGLTAAVYGASEGLASVVVDDVAVGGQIGTTSKIENYPGFPVGVSGTEFAQRVLAGTQIRRVDRAARLRHRAVTARRRAHHPPRHRRRHHRTERDHRHRRQLPPDPRRKPRPVQRRPRVLHPCRHL
jgi:thioredoxin reductase (NADPH)